MNDPHLVNLTAQITKRFLQSQKIEADQVPGLIDGVFKSLWEAQHPTPQVEPEVRQKRKYTRRAQGQAVDGSSGRIEDEQEAEEASAQQDEPEYVPGRPADWRNDDAWDENGQPKVVRPMPDFE